MHQILAGMNLISPNAAVYSNSPIVSHTTGWWMYLATTPIYNPFYRRMDKMIHNLEQTTGLVTGVCSPYVSHQPLIRYRPIPKRQILPNSPRCCSEYHPSLPFFPSRISNFSTTHLMTAKRPQSGLRSVLQSSPVYTGLQVLISSTPFPFLIHLSHFRNGKNSHPDRNHSASRCCIPGFET